MQITPLTHHLNQACYWLEQSESGRHSTSITYAALEMRYSVERLAVHYWSQLETGHPEGFQIAQIVKFKSMEVRIYALTGHQKQLDLTFKYFSILMRCLSIEVEIEPPKISLLSRIWHESSDICHIGWVLACALNPKMAEDAFAMLKRSFHIVERMVRVSSSIPLFDGAEAIELRNSFVRGERSEQDIIEWAEKNGLYAVHKPSGPGSAEFVGTAVQPRGGGG